MHVTYFLKMCVMPLMSFWLVLFLFTNFGLFHVLRERRLCTTSHLSWILM
jgi:hypothetical protein